jgi:hypothetical protein
MRVWTLIELFRLTRAELFGLYGEIVNAIGGNARQRSGTPHRSRQSAKHPQGFGAATLRSPMSGGL